MSDPATYLKQAFQALLRGDKAERDRLCDLAQSAQDQQDRLTALKPTDPLKRQ